MAEVDFTDKEGEPEDAHENPIETKPKSESVRQDNVVSRAHIYDSQIEGPTINAGSDNKRFKFEQDKGMWLGDANFSSAPFSVDMSGNVVADSIKITASSGSEVDWSYISNIAVKNIDIAESLTVVNTDADVTQTQLDAGASIDDAKASGVTFISGGYINTGIIDASRIDTGVLNASYINIGSATDFDYGYDPSTKLDSSDVGNLADYDLVVSAMQDESVIVGGYIDASYLTADNITTGTLHANYIEVGTINAKDTLNGPAEADADVTSSNETFSQNSDIDAKQTTNGPDEANADVTGNNTANDTNYLGGALIENLSAVAVGINGELSLQSHALLDVTNIGMTDELHISDDWYIYPSSRTVPSTAPLNITNLGTDYNEAITNWDQHPYNDQEGKIGTYDYSYDRGYFWTLYTDDGNVTAWQTHDDIQMIKDIETKEIEAKTVKAKGPECSKSEAWDLSGLPDEIQKGGKVSHGALNGLLIGTLKQLIDKVETLENEVETLK